MPASTMQTAPAQEAGRPQPQTTVEADGGPFVRHSQPGRRQQYASVGNAAGASIQNPITQVPGYIRAFRIRVNATGGSSSGTATALAAPDGPYNVISQVILKDSFGTPLIVGPGYEIGKLVPKYGGQFLLGAQADPGNTPSYVAVSSNSATGATTGNFTFSTALPLEFVKAMGVLSGANASLLPTLQTTLAASLSSVYTSAPSVLPSAVELDVDSDFYWLPEGANIEPPGLGTTCQWVYQQCPTLISSGTTTRVQLPRLGGYLHTLIFICRDTGNSNVRCDGWGARTRIYVDGVPLYDTRDDQWQDDMASQFQASNFFESNTFLKGTTAISAAIHQQAAAVETGVRVWTRKTSLNQISNGLLDTGESWLSTNPGTLIEVEGAPWASVGTGPFQLNVIIGQVVPSGRLIQGLPEL